MTAPQILAIDPGTLCGYAYANRSGVWDLAPRKARKRPPRPADREESRCGQLYLNVHEIVQGMRWEPSDLTPKRIVVVVEGALGFYRGKSAVQVAHNLRGAIKAACHVCGAEYREVQPQDWKRTLFGKANVEPSEYLARAQVHLGLRSESEDEAAARWLLEWAKRYVVGQGGMDRRASA